MLRRGGGRDGGVDARALRPRRSSGDRGRGADQLGGLRAGDGAAPAGAGARRRPPCRMVHPDAPRRSSSPAARPTPRWPRRCASSWSRRPSRPRGGPEAGQFLLERGLPGLRIEETWDSVGMRASGSHDLVLDAVRVPAGALLSRRPYARRERYGGRRKKWRQGLRLAPRRSRLRQRRRRRRADALGRRRRQGPAGRP